MVVVVVVVVVDVVVVDDVLVGTTGGAVVVVVLEVVTTPGLVVGTTNEGGLVGVAGTWEATVVGGGAVTMGMSPTTVVVVVVAVRPRVGRVVTVVDASVPPAEVTGFAVAEIRGSSVSASGAVEAGTEPPSRSLPPRRSFHDARLLADDDVGDGSAEAAGRPGDAMVTRSDRSRTNALANSVPTTTTVAMITTVAVRCMAWPRGRR